MNVTQVVVVLICCVVAIALLGYPLFVDLSAPDDTSSWSVEAVSTGGGGASVIKVTGPCGDACNPANATIYLIDPGGGYHGVGKGVMEPASGGVWYIFHYPLSDADAPGYWITDDPDMVFTKKYIEDVEPFDPGGIWMVDITPAGGGEKVDLSVAL